MPHTTYIIPIRIESPDRERNVSTSVRYLLKNTDGIILIKEYAKEQLVPRTLGEEVMENDRVKYMYEEGQGAFHRTRILNDMLELVDTPVTCNYDADVILSPSTCRSAETLIMSNEADAVYPYPHASTGQIQVFFDNKKDRFLSSLKIEDIISSKWRFCWAHAGFCVFVRTKDYIKAGGEHEGFVSYGPEDGERITRLETMGLAVKRLNDQVVYHMEHSRTHDSSTDNPHYSSNHKLFDDLTKMTRTQLTSHLINQPYVVNRGWKGVIS